MAAAHTPYRIHYGHWSIEAWAEGGWGTPGKLIAEIPFPVGNCGPFDPPGPQREALITRLRQEALAALAATEGRS